MQAPIPTPARAQGTLLLVDDEEDMLYVLNRLLREDGYRILTAEDGKSALEALSSNSVDVILTDQRMPDMMGTDLLCRAKELYPETVRLVHSGYADLNAVTTAINEGAVYKFLTKPWNDVQLKKNIAEAFRLKYLDDENRALRISIENAHKQLLEKFDEYQQTIFLLASTLSLHCDIIESIPIPMAALDVNKALVLANKATYDIFNGKFPDQPIQHLLNTILDNNTIRSFEIPKGSGQHYYVEYKILGTEENGEGYILAFIAL